MKSRTLANIRPSCSVVYPVYCQEPQWTEAFHRTDLLNCGECIVLFRLCASPLSVEAHWVDGRDKISVTLAKHSHRRALKIRAGPLEFFALQTFGVRQNHLLRTSLTAVSIRQPSADTGAYQEISGPVVLNRVGSSYSGLASA